VDVNDDFFNPANITVANGATVTWTWRGSSQHNVTFEDAQGSSATQSAGIHTRTFGMTGTVRYRCTIHSTSFTSGMIGSVVVQ
jgi:plastocyanin